MTPERTSNIDDIFERIMRHSFHPLNDRNFTVDRELNEDGIADLDDEDWRIRVLAISDLVSGGPAVVESLEDALTDDDVHVRYIAAKAAGVRADEELFDALERVLTDDPRGAVRAQAAMSLGQIGDDKALESLRHAERADDRDVKHQAELAIAQIERERPSTDELRDAFASIDPATFGRVTTGDRAPPISLPDTEGGNWTLDDADGWTMLIWVFADWCPVCHREFDELIELRDRFESNSIDVVTIECHDVFRGRVMVGKELEPAYWFAEGSFHDTYTEQIWWPHLLDRAGSVGATYGIDPFAFSVHGEYINRPATVVTDPEGTVRFAYIGTFWGDRPSVEQVLEMIESERFEFEHPDRLHPTN